MRFCCINQGLCRRLLYQLIGQKILLMVCIIFVLLFLLVTNFYPSGRFSCTNPQHTSGTGSISRHQHQFDKNLFSYLGTLLEGTKINSDFSDWITVIPHIFAYSAYISESGVPEFIKTRYYIKILTVVLPSLPVLRTNLTKLSCVLNFSDGRIISTTAYLSILPEDHKKCYKAAFFLCPVATHAIPSKVSLIYNNSSPKWVKVQSALLSHGQSLPYEISICVRPLFGPYNSIVQIAEFIGYYQSMGVKRFLFYNDTVTTNVSKFLQMLSNNSVIHIDVLPWSLSNINMDEYLLHADGQIIFNHDCILRLTSSSRFVAIVDLDEFIMPQKSLNLGQVLRKLESENVKAGSFLLQAIMFCEELLPRVWDNKSLPFVTQTVAKRQKTPWSYTYRSKYVVMPQRINVAMIHEISQHVEPFHSINVSPSTILLYHCRECCNLWQPMFFNLFLFGPLEGDVFVDDKRMRKIAKQLDDSVSITLVQKLYNEAKALKK